MVNEKIYTYETFYVWWVFSCFIIFGYFFNGPLQSQADRVPPSPTNMPVTRKQTEKYRRRNRFLSTTEWFRKSFRNERPTRNRGPNMIYFRTGIRRFAYRPVLARPRRLTSFQAHTGVDGRPPLLLSAAKRVRSGGE